MSEAIDLNSTRKLTLSEIENTNSIYTLNIEMVIDNDKRNYHEKSLENVVNDVLNKKTQFKTKLYSLMNVLFYYSSINESLEINDDYLTKDVIFKRFIRNYEYKQKYENELKSIKDYLTIKFVFKLIRSISVNETEENSFHTVDIDDLKAFDIKNIEIKQSMICIEPKQKSFNAEYIIDVYSLLSFMKRISTSFDNDILLYYRGHSDLTYRLLPGLFRDNSINYEKILYEEFLIRKNEEFVNKSTVIEQLAFMQHYGLKTRLLDITSNPLIALYFACGGDEKVSGELIILKEDKNRVTYIDSDSVRITSMLSKLNINDKLIVLNCSDDESDDFKLLLHYIKFEASHFMNTIKVKDLHDIYFVKARYNGDSRIANQSGNFILGTDHRNFEEKISDKLVSKNVKLIIPGVCKKQILDELDLLSINRYHVYTSLSETADYLNTNIKKL